MGEHKDKSSKSQDAEQQVQDDQDAAATGQDADLVEDQPRVVNNGDVSDPGNSGGFGEVSGEVTGQADKPNG